MSVIVVKGELQLKNAEARGIRLRSIDWFFAKCDVKGCEVQIDGPGRKIVEYRMKSHKQWMHEL